MTEPVDAGPIASKAKRILVVDDEPSIVRLIQENLELQGYRVETANNGVQALVKIKANPLHLVITDVMMPEMDGFELLTAVRSEQHLDNLPVLILGARPSDIDTDKEPEDVCRDMPFGMHMIWKPFTPQKLVAKVEQVLFGSPAKD